MSYSISDKLYDKEGGDDSGRDSLNFVPEKHYVSAVDAPGNGAGDPAGAKEEAREVREADREEAVSARRGASMAVEGGSVQGESLNFTVSDGLHRTGPEVGALFERAVRDSGGVRQSTSWTSDAAPGVHRCIVEHSLTLESLSKPDEHKGLQDQGSGRTFETQRRSHWTHDRLGG